MVKIKTFFDILRRKWIKLRLQPIRVFCLHHVSEKFDAQSMYPCDWIDIYVFKSKIIDLLKQGYQFISLTEAYTHLKKDHIRTKKYAVLTFDDGYKSLVEILPWLEEQNIPATLFINGKYLDGKSYRETPKEQYLTRDELFAMTSHLIEVAHHGWEHTYIPNMSDFEIEESIILNTDLLVLHPRYVPFWAYTCGCYKINTKEIMKKHGIIPVKIEGNVNYNWLGYVDRELL